MNFTPEFGWYYIDANDRTPSWTGVPYFWNFMTRNVISDGPIGRPSGIFQLRPGDFVQIRFQSHADEFAHTPVVVSVGYPPTLDSILVAAHSNDADNRPLSTYEEVEEFRFLHILGVFQGVSEENPENEE